MIKDVIAYLNNRLEVVGYFNTVHCLAEKIEKEGKVYPAIYGTSGEYAQINLDVNGSLCYWRKNGDVSFSKQDNETSIGTQYQGTIPLKLVGFIKKEGRIDDAYFSDNVCASLIANLTVSNSALKQMLKAKRVTITSTGYVTEPRKVASEEYENIDFEIRYTHAYFSIDFELSFVSNSQCYDDLCNEPMRRWGFVTIYESDGTTIRTFVRNNTSYTLDQVSEYKLITLLNGAINGINTVFVFAHPPIQVVYNGQIISESNYTLVGNTVTLNFIPFTGETLTAYGNY